MQSSPMIALARHKLVWLTKEGWEEAINGKPETERRAAIFWRERGWPLVVRRNDADALQDQVCLGIALAPAPGSGSKLRIGLRVHMSGIEQMTDPLSLERVIAMTPAGWQPHLSSLHRQASDLGLSRQLQVYGSVALQCLTGVRYITPKSDLDLLFHPDTRVDLENGLALLCAYERMVPLDGEIVFPNGRAVAWKEWRNAERAGNAFRVLAKDLNSVRLMSMNELRVTLEQENACDHC
jgi:phosphoribosyl-dephospho-CoA transferase